MKGTASPFRGTYQDFLSNLLRYESGIIPERFDWYKENFQQPVMRYPALKEPGRALRESRSGDLIFETVTVEQYFRNLDVLELFDPDSIDSLRIMQYSSTNALGFIGYQIGEAILTDCGFYSPAIRAINGKQYKVMYGSSMPNITWADGVQEHIVDTQSALGQIVATDTNTWRGTFTGKHDIFSVRDLKDPKKQEHVIEEIIKFNVKKIVDELTERGTNIYEVLDSWNMRHVSNEEIRVTMSGVIAAAHLSGAAGTANYLSTRVSVIDEFNTSTQAYIYKFSGFETPFDLDSQGGLT